MKKLQAFFKIFLVPVLIAAAFQSPAEAYTVSYRQTVTVGQGQVPMAMRVWVKDDKMRVESAAGGQKAIMIYRNDGVYNYLPSQNMVMKIPQKEQNLDYVKDGERYLAYLEDQGARKTGTEVLEGRLCDIYKYSDNFGSDVTVWVWREKKFPVKMVMDNRGVKTQVLFSDIRMNEPVPESLFELPGGARVVDMTSMKSMFKAFQD
ncbi:MAG: hypothetical protein U9R44_02340 [Candidatus Omnitrophota bacterium]|nr:hypothetical protein [Candidatus Omnitrophota bacterium]